jgi:hypothetical protein
MNTSYTVPLLLHYDSIIHLETDLMIQRILAAFLRTICSLCLYYVSASTKEVSLNCYVVTLRFVAFSCLFPGQDSRIFIRLFKLDLRF